MATPFNPSTAVKYETPPSFEDGREHEPSGCDSCIVSLPVIKELKPHLLLLLDRRTVLFELLGKDQELISSLLAIVLFRHALTAFLSQPFTCLSFRPLEVWLQTSLLFEGATREAFLHPLH
jgi:hypothetical protein